MYSKKSFNGLYFKIFAAVIDSVAYSVMCFFAVSHFYSSLIFADKDGADPSEAHYGAPALSLY